LPSHSRCPWLTEDGLASGVLLPFSLRIFDVHLWWTFSVLFFFF
jgi:hypothetical protein